MDILRNTSYHFVSLRITLATLATLATLTGNFANRTANAAAKEQIIDSI